MDSGTKHSYRLVAATLLLLVFSSIPARASDPGSKPEETTTAPFSRGFGYLGAFWVTQANTELRLFSTELPLGARLNMKNDLGVRDSFTVPRMTLGWRFGDRHILAGSYYNLNRKGVQNVERTISLPGEIEILLEAQASTEYTTEVAKIQYTYLFHRDEKVSLGIGAGFFVAKLGLNIVATGGVGEDTGALTTFNESVTAPLPVLGFRLAYRITPKWGVLATSDWFLLSYDDTYRGLLSDTQIFAAHRTFKQIGFAAGVNFQTINAEFLDEDILWQADAGVVGFLGVMTFYF